MFIFKQLNTISFNLCCQRGNIFFTVPCIGQFIVNLDSNYLFLKRSNFDMSLKKAKSLGQYFWTSWGQIPDLRKKKIQPTLSYLLHYAWYIIFLINCIYTWTVVIFVVKFHVHSLPAFCLMMKVHWFWICKNLLQGDTSRRDSQSQ